MDTIFSEDPQFRRVQYKKLSDNVREWQQEIAAMVTEKLPKDLGVDVTVVFQQVDDEKGYAVGTAICRDTGSDRTIGVPVIVKSWHLAPIDLFFAAGQLYPISEDNLAKIFYQNSLGAGIAPQTAPPNMADDQYAEMRNPPLGGKYSYSAPFSFLQHIKGTLGAEDIFLLKQAVAAQPALLNGFARHKTFDVLKKYADETPAEQTDINKNRAQSVFTVKKDGPDSYRLYSANDEVYDPVVISTNRRGAQTILNLKRAELWEYEKDPMLVADHNGFVTLAPPESPYGKPVVGPKETALGEHKNPFVFDPLQHDLTARNIDSYGRYGVKDRDGVLAKGWVIPHVIDFDGKTVSNKLFLGKALAAYQGRIAGIPLLENDDVNLAGDRPDTGKIGVLVYREDKDVCATIPFQVTAVTVYKNLRSLAIATARGEMCNLIITPNIDGIVKIQPSAKSELGPLLGPKSNYFVSAKMVFVRMPRLCPVSETAEDFRNIVAPWLDFNPIKVAMQNGRYVFRGKHLAKLAMQGQGSYGPFQKVAFDFSSLARHEAEFLLASWGLPLTKCAEVLDGVKSKIVLDVHHLRIPDAPSSTKTASPKQEALKKLAGMMRAPIAELVKIAGTLDDAQSVDAVLSLGFVNAENISRFASTKSMLWEVTHMLAKLLLGSRLGMDDIPEESCRSAIEHLQRVIDGLDRLKMLEENGTKTSAARSTPTTRHAGGRLLRGADPVGMTR